MPETLTTEPTTLEASTAAPTNQPLAVRRPEVITAAAERAAAAPAPLPHDPPAYEGPTAIIRALAAAQAAFQPVAKTKTATVAPRDGGRSYTYQYADLADVFNMALPILARHGLALIQPIKRVGGALMLVTEIWHETGQVLRDDGLPLMVTQSPQAFGSALTYMRRYGACSLLGIAPDADEDAQLAEADRREAAELERARARNARAEEAAAVNAARAKKRADAANPEEPVITGDQVKEWNQARKKAGWSVAEATAYVQDTYRVPLTKLPLRHFEQAMAWARTKPAGDPQPAQAAASASATTSVPTLNNEQQRTFWDTAKKHGKSGGDVERYLRETFNATSTAAIPVARLAEAIEWATASNDSRPPASRDEQNAREGFKILGLNLAEQGALVDQHQGDWEAINRAVSLEVDRRDSAQ